MRDGGPSVVVVAVGFFDESVARRDKGDAHVAADPAQPVNVRVLEVVILEDDLERAELNSKDKPEWIGVEMKGHH